MNQGIGSNKKKYIPPQMKIYSSLKDITAGETCLCSDVVCPVYCSYYTYPLNLSQYGNYCPRIKVDLGG